MPRNFDDRIAARAGWGGGGDDDEGSKDGGGEAPAVAAAAAAPPQRRQSIVAPLPVGVEAWMEALAADESSVPEGYAPVGRIGGWGHRM